MPRAFTQKEKLAIGQALMKTGLRHFSSSGIRKMRVDDLCKEIGIAKGSFYAFFKSKEELFMAIADERDIMHKSDMVQFFKAQTGTPRSAIEAFFNFMLDRIETDPILKILRDTGEINHLIRQVPPETMMENQRRDREFMAQISQILQTRFDLPHASAATIEGLLTILLSTCLQGEHLKTASTYHPTIELLRDMFVSRLIRGPFND